MTLTDVPSTFIRRFPALAERVAWTPLCGGPTPVERLTFDNALSCWVKRDDYCGPLLGGSKIRKLEFFLGEAERACSRSLVTFGPYNSNHLLATALYGRKVGLNVICIATDGDRDDAGTRERLTAMETAGAAVVHCPHRLRSEEGQRFLEPILSSVQSPTLIPFGGGGARGALGYVNAAFELADQIARNELPPPDRIYVAMASMGTAAGLAVGAALAGVPCEIHGILVVDDDDEAETRLANCVAHTSNLLDVAVPAVSVVVDRRFTRFGYRGTTPQIEEARRIGIRFGLRLELTYTAKVLAAMLDDAEGGSLNRKTALFWNTSPRDYVPVISERCRMSPTRCSQ